jgi:uncharacterized protein YpmB
MINAFKKEISKFILEILIIVIAAVGSILWGFNSSIAASAEKDKATDSMVNSMKQDMDDFRKENKADHDRIIEILMKKVP